ncbi:winged helix-turn-helix transcriptional regulator [Paenibacillus gansuensis]|uniref:Winged helix-turn-helix transcriptional regulator n=1 Tax=Paenibacillus gansuensis TaxID=306542 RepID=A0ABW5PBB2_9BACL
MEYEDKPEAICTVLQILNSKWGYRLIAELASSPRRFNQLNKDLPMISTQSLTNALRHLEQHGMVLREVTPSVPITVEYSLTPKGEEFFQALKQMEQWAERWA